PQPLPDGDVAPAQLLAPAARDGFRQGGARGKGGLHGLSSSSGPGAAPAQKYNGGSAAAKSPWQAPALPRPCSAARAVRGPAEKVMRGREFLERLREEVLIGDGALGTMISERGVGRETNYERLNLTHPEFIKDLHAAYVAAGAQLIETNTFGANRTKLPLCAAGAPDLCAADVTAITRAGVALARAVAGGRAYVAGSVGPLAERSGPHTEHVPPTDDQVRELFREQVVALADAGADLLILETFTELTQ